MRDAGRAQRRMKIMRIRKGKAGNRRRSTSIKRRKNAKAGMLGRLVKPTIGLAILLGCLMVAYHLLGSRPERRPERPPEGAPGAELPGQMKVTLFFSDSQAEFLSAEERPLERGLTPSGLAKAVMEELARGPRTGLHPTLPKGTRILKADVGGDGVCTVDLSREVQAAHPGGSSAELMTVYSIVESLAFNVPGVKAVQILVDGKKTDTLAGHIFIGAPVSPEPSYVKRW